MKYSTLIFVILCLMISFATSQAQIYQYVDENGKIQYTNMAPPSSNKTVVIDESKKDDQESSDEERLQRKKKEIEEKYLEKQENERKANDQAKLRQREQDRIDQSRKKEERRLASKARAERDFILKKEEDWISKCESFPFVVGSECEDRVHARFKKVIQILDHSAEYYFENKYRIDEDTKQTLNVWYKAQKAKSDKGDKTLKRRTY